MVLSLRRVTLLCVLSVALPGQSAELTPFLHHYEASYEGLPFHARGTRSLERRSDGRFQFETTLGALFLGVEEQATFELDGAGTPRPLYYVTRQQGLGRQRERRLIFDWERGRLTRTGDKPREDPLTPGTFDPLSWQLALKQRLLADWPDQGTVLSLTMTDGGDPTDMRWRVLGPEALPPAEAGAGPGERALALERQFEPDSEERMKLWFAEADGALLRLEHRENGRLLTIWLTARGDAPTP
jgi:hypothetical protein